MRRPDLAKCSMGGCSATIFCLDLCSSGIWERKVVSIHVRNVKLRQLCRQKVERKIGKLNKLAARESEVPEILKFTMLYDLYARENLKSRPEWAQEILYRPFCEDFYRDETL